MNMRFNWRTLLIAIGLVVAIVLLIDFNRRMEELNSLTTKLEAVRAEATTVMQTQVAMVTKVAYATSDKAVEEWAYQNKWVRVGEHPVALVPAGGVTATPAPPPVIQTDELPNWRIWVDLFFGAY
jgi:hypothetical protein